MKQASEALINLLHSSDKFYIADLYIITLHAGTVLRYTSLDIPLTVGGVRFEPFTIDRDNITQTIGLEVDELTLTMRACANDKMPNGTTIFQAMRTGVFDNAVLQLDLVFSPNPWQYNMPPIAADYALVHFKGRMDVDECGGVRAKISVRAMTELLDTKQPRNLVCPGCLHTLYDENCGVEESVYTIDGSCGEDCTKSVISNNLTQEDGYFDLGTITFTSGLNNNISRAVRKYLPGKMLLAVPLPFLPDAGDAFTLSPGCDGTMYSCRNKFNNIDNFRGYPFVPTPETIL